jgi:trimeric autotransporter adhesin
MKKFSLMLLALFALTACDDGTSPEVVAVDPLEVTLSPSATSIVAGTFDQATLTVRGGPTNIQPTWFCNSSDLTVAIATVNPLGCRITGVNRGTATVTAFVTRGSAGASTATQITVTANPNFIPVPTRVNVLVPGNGFVLESLRATAVPLTASGDTIRGLAVTWASNNTTVATVSPLGVVTLLSAGTATISATVAGVTGSATITSNLVPVQTISLTQRGDLYVGRTAIAVPRVIGTDGSTLPLTQRSVVWRSSAPAVAVVDNRGTITGLSVGTTRILLTVDGEPTSLDVVVTRVAVDRVVVTPDNTTIVLGGTRQFIATAFDINGDVISNTALDGRTFEWSTIRIDNTGQTSRLVTSTNGLVTATAVGFARIRARIDGVAGLSTVEVVQP